MVDFFKEQLLSTGSFGMWRRYKYGADTKWVLDLHLMTFEVTAFVLQYVFEFEREHIEGGDVADGEDVDSGKREDLYILCGSGKHRKAKRREEGKDDGNSIALCVIEELKSWTPPIKAERSKQNEAFVVVDRNDIERFYRQKGHFGARR